MLKSYFDNYHEAKTTKKKLKKFQKRKNVTVFSVCLFDTEQHVISPSQLNKIYWVVILLILVNY